MGVKRLLLAVLLVTALIGLITVDVHGGTVQVFVDHDPPIDDPNIADDSLQSGSKFNITVNVANVPDLYSYKFKLNWTGSMLNATNIYQGPFLQSGGPTIFIPQINNTDNFVYVTCSLFMVAGGVWDNGTLAIIEFLVEDYGSTDLQLYDTILVNSLSVQIVHSPVSGYFSNKIPGDIDGDGDVDPDDVYVLAMAYGAVFPDPRYVEEADFDGDGDVDPDDVYVLAQNYGKSI